MFKTQLINVFYFVFISSITFVTILSIIALIMGCSKTDKNNSDSMRVRFESDKEYRDYLDFLEETKIREGISEFKEPKSSDSVRDMFESDEEYQDYLDFLEETKIRESIRAFKESRKNK